ncbi:hypothetical protein SK128_006097 [Halocaridina rubra]|uniref:Uncharacterized protein n=1 Tax=Halocaridina rubra TaxID=373956 RepID=A0AAN8WRV1_HALRR
MSQGKYGIHCPSSRHEAKLFIPNCRYLSESPLYDLLPYLHKSEVYSTLASLCAPDMPQLKNFSDLVEILEGHFIVKPSYHR